MLAVQRREDFAGAGQAGGALPGLSSPLAPYFIVIPILQNKCPRCPAGGGLEAARKCLTPG